MCYLQYDVSKFCVGVVSILKIYKTDTLVKIISGLTTSITEHRHVILQITHFKAVNNLKLFFFLLAYLTAL